MRLQIFDLASRTLSDTPKLVLVGGTYTCVVGIQGSGWGSPSDACIAWGFAATRLSFVKRRKAWSESYGAEPARRMRLLRRGLESIPIVAPTNDTERSGSLLQGGDK